MKSKKEQELDLVIRSQEHYQREYLRLIDELNEESGGYSRGDLIRVEWSNGVTEELRIDDIKHSKIYGIYYDCSVVEFTLQGEVKKRLSSRSAYLMDLKDSKVKVKAIKERVDYEL